MSKEVTQGGRGDIYHDSDVKVTIKDAFGEIYGFFFFMMVTLFFDAKD